LEYWDLRSSPTIASLLLAATLVGPAQADDWADCTADEPHRNIKGCTRLINSAADDLDTLSVAYTNRGVAYEIVGKYQKSLLALNEAIRIDPLNARAFLAQLPQSGTQIPGISVA
jgi:tetratricopeptide (TPR) repeat protein